jgi:hypothetical protein
VDRRPGRFEHEADAADAGVNILDLGEKARRRQETADRKADREKSFHKGEVALVV